MRIALPFGSYVMADTPVHRLDVRVKLVLLLALTVTVFVCDDPLLIAASALVLVLLVIRAKVPPASLARGVMPCIIILVFSLLANSFVLDGTADYVIWGSCGLSWMGVRRGIIAVCRIILLVCYALVVSSTTTSSQLTDGLVSLMRPLGALHVPVGDIAMTLSVALRFIPVSASEFDRIQAAQMARGARFGEGSVWHRLGLWCSVLIPVIVSLFVRADELADSMRDRCYQGVGRTRLTHPLRTSDVVVLLCGLVACVGACILVNLPGWMAWA